MSATENNAAITAGRYVAVPFEGMRQDVWGVTRNAIQLQSNGAPLDVSGYRSFTTFAGFSVKWAEIPVDELAALEFVTWAFDSEISGSVAFYGSGKQAVNFFRTLKKQWQPELVPEDVFVANF